MQQDVASTTTGEPELDIDEVLKRAGSNCRFNVTLYFFTFYLVTATACNFVLSVFTGNEIAWKCANSSSYGFCKTHSEEIIHSYSERYNEKCRMNVTDWIFISSPSYSYVTEFNLTCGRTYLAALVSSSYYVGGLLGSTFSGTISDKFGRKPVLIGSLITFICSAIGCSFAKNIWQLMVGNVARGFSNIANYYTMYVYLSEFSIPPKRVLATSVFLIADTASFLLIDLMAFWERDWRKLQLYAAILPIFGVIAFILLPESPRWLLASGKPNAAMHVLRNIMRYNGKSITKDFVLKAPRSSEETTWTYLDLIRNKKVFTLTSSVSAIWFTMSLVYYTITLESPSLGGDMYKTFALSTIVDILALAAFATLCNRIGRKRTNLGGLFISGIFAGCMLFVPNSSSSRYTINMILSVIARFGVAITFDGMFTWTFELFPTVVRSQGVSICVIIERLALIGCPFITRVLQKFNPIYPIVIMCTLAILATLFGLVLPETNMQPTRERYEDFFRTEVTNIELGKVNEDIIEQKGE